MSEQPATILVVDDLPDWQATLKGMLSDAGFAVRTAGGQAEALALLESTPCQMAVLDIRLIDEQVDNVEGLDLAAQIRARWPHMKIVAITGYGTQEILEKAIAPNAAGVALVDDYLSKTETESLVDTVLRVLG